MTRDLLGPIGRDVFMTGAPGWCVRPGLLVWRFDATLYGASLFGRVDAAAMREMCELLAASARPHLPAKMDIIADGRAHTSIEPDAVEAATRFFVREHELCVESSQRIVIVSDGGVASAALVGSMAFGGLVVPIQRADDLVSAAKLLGRQDAADLLPAVEAAIVETTGVPSWLSRLRHALRAAGGRLSPAEAAQRVGLSMRTLQRKLGEQGLTFFAELTNLRLTIAAELLAETDDKIEAIAARAGFTSPVHLARTFARERGVTPDQFRRSKRTA